MSKWYKFRYEKNDDGKEIINANKFSGYGQWLMFFDEDNGRMWTGFFDEDYDGSVFDSDNGIEITDTM